MQANKVPTLLLSVLLLVSLQLNPYVYIVVGGAINGGVGSDCNISVALVGGSGIRTR